MAIAIVLAIPAGSQTVRAATGPRCYVNIAAAGTPDGNSWLTAYTNLQTALTDPNCDEVWVADGVYKPGASLTDTFNILPGTKVYGGFAGGETALSQRNILTNPTILSGDIDSNDTNTDGNNIAETVADIQGFNSYRIVKMDGTTTPVTGTTVLDSFVITGANGDLSSWGGGLYCDGSGAGGHVCSPTLNLLIFSGNRAGSGGAICAWGRDGGISSPTISYSLFTGNSAGYGGAINADAINGGTSSPIIYWVTFSGNEAINGGAFYANGGAGTSNPAFGNVNFDGNTAGNYGGAVYADGSSAGIANATYNLVTFSNNSASNGGAMYNSGGGGNSSPTLTNVTFHGNSADFDGGAIWNSAGSGGVSSPSLRNVTFNGNSAGNAGGAMRNHGLGGTSTPALTNVIMWEDSGGGSSTEISNTSAMPVIDHSVIQGSGGSGGSWHTDLGTDGGGNLDADPKLAALAFNGGPIKTMALLVGSSAIDTGADADCPPYDARGLNRFRGSHCDIGSFERVPPEKANFDGDYASDAGYFHAATGLWAILQSSQNFSYASPLYVTWGQTGDIVTPGDFDGDMKLDPTIRRPPAGGQSMAYMMLLSSTGYDYGSAVTVPAGWPGLGDTPVIGDFNGDKIDDPGIWRGNTGVWIVALSPSFTTYAFRSWGASGDTPIVADVDGDGISDIGYWRPSTGVWGFLQSSQGFSYSAPAFLTWGSATDKPVTADYDGDGKADPAVVIPPAGGQSQAYRILLSTKNYNASASVTVPAGWPGLGDTPVPADYDGDGKADPGIWRGNSGVWIIPKSSTSYTTFLFGAWGASGDQIAR
jgi:predicted outer membrane repeat protein